MTGGSGYLGTHVRSFFGADDFSRRSGLDVTSDYDCEKVADYDVVIHLAALLDKAEEAAESCFRTNAEGTANLLRHARPGTVFVYASTKDVYGANAEGYEEVPETCPTDYRGQTALEWSKLLGERYVEYYAARAEPARLRLPPLGYLRAPVRGQRAGLRRALRRIPEAPPPHPPARERRSRPRHPPRRRLFPRLPRLHRLAPALRVV